MGQTFFIRVVTFESIMRAAMPVIYDPLGGDVDTKSVVEFVGTPHLETLVIRSDIKNPFAKPCVVAFDVPEKLV